MCKHAPDQDQTRLDKTKPLLFSLGQVFVTRGAVDLLDRIGINAEDLLSRHQRGDWGDVHDGDIVANNHGVITNDRLHSIYRLGSTNEKIWIFTESDRSITSILLPGEY